MSESIKRVVLECDDLNTLLFLNYSELDELRNKLINDMKEFYLLRNILEYDLHTTIDSEMVNNIKVLFEKYEMLSSKYTTKAKEICLEKGLEFKLTLDNVRSNIDYVLSLLHEFENDNIRFCVIKAGSELRIINTVIKTDTEDGSGLENAIKLVGRMYKEYAYSSSLYKNHKEIDDGTLKIDICVAYSYGKDWCTVNYKVLDKEEDSKVIGITEKDLEICTKLFMLNRLFTEFGLFIK